MLVRFYARKPQNEVCHIFGRMSSEQGDLREAWRWWWRSITSSTPAAGEAARGPSSLMLEGGQSIANERENWFRNLAIKGGPAAAQTAADKLHLPLARRTQIFKEQKSNPPLGGGLNPLWPCPAALR